MSLVKTELTSLPAYSITWGSAPAAKQIAWLGEGDFCTCYLVNAAYVFRFAKHSEASEAMRVEQCLLPLLKQHLSITVPEPLFGGHCVATGQAMLGYGLVPGEPLEHTVLNRLPVGNQAALIVQMAEAVRSLHALPTQLAHNCGVPAVSPLQHLTSIMNEARIVIAPRLAANVWQYHEELLALYAREPALHTYRPALLHGDLSPDHFLADAEQGKLTGMIDFGDVCISDPAWDIIYICEDYGLEVLQAFLHWYDAENAPLLARKVQVYQHLNNVDYCLQMHMSGDEEQLQAAIDILEEQALTGARVFRR